jgi:outer membrane translocation and assembly module TamA
MEGNSMVKITEIVRDSRNGNCPAVHEVEGDLKIATGETIPSGMLLVQGYRVEDSNAKAQIQFGAGEDVLAVQESLILRAADAIRARG